MSIKEKKLFCSVLIPSYDRASQLKNCVDSILSSPYVPDEIIIAYSKDSDISQINKEKNQKIIFIRSKNSIPVKRNLLIDHAKNNICIFIDDDIEVNNLTLFNTVRYHLKYQDLFIIGGICYPILYNPFSKFSFNIFYERYLLSRSKLIYTDFCPTMLFSFKKEFLLKEKSIKFDEYFLALEDIDFCLTAKKEGYKITMARSITAKHSYRNTIGEFIKSFDSYFNYVSNIYHKHNVDIFRVNAYKNNTILGKIKHFYSKVTTLTKKNNILLSIIYEIILLKNLYL